LSWDDRLRAGYQTNRAIDSNGIGRATRVGVRDALKTKSD
jgi:hypothetical protein